MMDWKQKELLVIRDTKSQNHDGCGWKIRVCQYILDGESKSVKLESGEYWKDKESGETRYKTKGFSKKDLESCKPHWKEIIRLMDNPPPVESGTTGEPSQDIEEIPF
jgi:hypothetical protein